MDPAERAAWLRLLLTPGIGPRTARMLLAAFGLPQAVFAAGRTALGRHVPAELSGVLRQPPAAAIEATIEKTQRWLDAAADRSLLTLADPDYPAALLECPDPPTVLFACGRRTLLATPALAIVGSRSCTQQGRETAEAFARTLTHGGLSIVSGLAVGIDAAAHRGALQAAEQGAGASTVAILGTGIDVVYPPGHRDLADAVRGRGLLLSEFVPGTPALARNFPRRNRIIAGLARGVLVVEAALRSGSLITARLAGELGREVFAIPGSIHSPTARGCHRLIKDGAKLVESAQDVLEELHLPAPATSRRPEEAAAPDGIGAEQSALLAALGHDPVDLDTLAQRCARDAGSLSAALLELELAQHVERLPGNRYQRLR
ncbi:MAG TPA: DNA-processing protein DprA [Burkholderiaceae bacterium]|nr:DNA-processing protein DprA [Burkholderiaceae bacterium]